MAGLLGAAVETDIRVTARVLVDRRARAAKAAEEARRLDGEVERAEAEVGDARTRLERARARVAADRQAAELPADASPSALMDAARTSDEGHRVDAAFSRTREALQHAGFSWPGARETIGRMTGPERAAAVEAAEEESARLAEAREDAVADVTRARGELARAEADSRSGAAETANARLKAASETRAMAEAAAGAIRRRVEAAVLAAARDSFAAENRSPILERASEVFTTFTGGAFDTLEQQLTDGESFVQAHRVADDAHVGVNGLSDGTRDQLVASVRIAAAEDAELPFIADDLFVNADDARAANGFRVLARLAAGRQVIYLTHHHHLEGVARSALGDAVSVHRL